MIAKAASILIFLAGIIHFIVAQEHWAHAPAHGMVFVVIGLVQVLWSVLFWKNSTAGLFKFGIIFNGASLFLWSITRVLPAPFGHGPEFVSLIGVIVKLLELGGMILLIAWSYKTVEKNLKKPLFLTLISLLAAFLVYGVGIFSEQYLHMLKGEDDHMMPHHEEVQEHMHGH